VGPSAKSFTNRVPYGVFAVNDFARVTAMQALIELRRARITVSASLAESRSAEEIPGGGQ
jgi:hypothetical protein